MYIYVCTYMYIYMCIYIHIYICTYMCIYIRIHMNTNINVYVYIYIYICIQVCIFIYIYIFIHVTSSLKHTLPSRKNRQRSWRESGDVSTHRQQQLQTAYHHPTGTRVRHRHRSSREDRRRHRHSSHRSRLFATGKISLFFFLPRQRFMGMIRQSTNLPKI